jgi:hypothetical protein
MRVTKKPDAAIYDVDQYVGPDGPHPRGVCGDADCEIMQRDHVHTAHNNQAVALEPGDWVMPEPDGRGYYPIKPDIFDDRYTPVPNESYAAPGAQPELPTQTESVRIFAHCRTCRRDYGVNVPVRDPEGDVVTWVNAAATIAGAFHSYTSPKCLSRHLDFAIPVDGVNAVGAAAVPTSVPDQAPSFLKESPSGAEAEFEDEIVLPTDDELARSAPNAGTPIADDDTPPADKAAI